MGVYSGNQFVLHCCHCAKCWLCWVCWLIDAIVMMLCIDWTMFKLASYLWVRLFLSCYPRKATINGWNMFYWQFTDIQQKFRTHFNSLLSILNDWLQCAYLCNCNNMPKKLLIRFFLVPLKICFQKHNSSRKQKLETRFIIINTKLCIILISYE